MNLDFIKVLCKECESSSLDYKRGQYAFEKASDWEKSEILKDVLAMANAEREGVARILIGVDERTDRTGKIVGIDAVDVIDDSKLHQFVNSKTNREVAFGSVVVPLDDGSGRVVQVLELPDCRAARPFYAKAQFGHVAANAVYMRDGSSTKVASPERVREMGESLALGKARPVVELPDGVEIESDWSAVIVENATMDDLDEAAIAKAREGFVSSHPDRVTKEEVDSWSLKVLLEKVKLAVDGKLTRAALLLMGKNEAAVKLSPFAAQITWNLCDGTRAYEHFGPPFLLTTTEVYKRIRNFQFKIIPQGSLLPVSVKKYTEKVILEPLHNCIAHQDYYRQERIVVTEYRDFVELVNAGCFYEGNPVDYIDGFKRPKAYRNRLLAEAMAELHMIDSLGYGIHDVYADQRNRYLPMPDFETDNDHVLARVYGQVVDEAYSRLLIANADIPLIDIFNLDRIQKHKEVSSDALKRLREFRYVEGKGKQLRISAKIAALTNQRAEYIRLRATEDANLKRMILDYISEYGSATRQELDKLLRGKMHEALSESEKTAKISNLLTAMRKVNQIVSIGPRKASKWVLFKDEKIES